MPPEVPYPSASVPAIPEEATVSFTVKELLEQISRKLDTLATAYDARLAVLERAPVPIVNGELRMTQVEQHVAAHMVDLKAHEVSLKALEQTDTLQAGGVMFKNQIMAKLVGLASIMGVVAAVTFQLIQLVS